MPRADKYLVEHGYFDTRARAQAAIEAGRVVVDGQVVRKASQKIDPGAVVEAQLGVSGSQSCTADAM